MHDIERDVVETGVLHLADEMDYHPDHIVLGQAVSLGHAVAPFQLDVVQIRMRWASDTTVTTRADGLFARRGSRSFVRSIGAKTLKSHRFFIAFAGSQPEIAPLRTKPLGGQDS